MFLDNKYTRIYYQIVNRAQSRTLDGYTEKHHIIPKSLGGSNKKENLVELTAREHFICHWLLVKMCTDAHRVKMVYALRCMKRSGETHDRYNNQFTARVYEWYRIEHAKNHSIAMSGRELSTEQKLKISKAHTGKKGHPISAETKEKLRLANTGRVPTLETRQKLSDSQKGKKITGTHLDNLRAAAKNKPPVKDETRVKLREAFYKNDAINSPESIEKRRAKRIGHEVTDETRNKIRATLKDTYRKKGFKVKDDLPKKEPYVRKGKKKSEETKAKMRKPRSLEARENMRIASIKREALKKQNGYTVSEDTRNKLKERFTCPHCGKSSNKAMLSRFHNDNCKLKVLQNNS